LGAGGAGGWILGGAALLGAGITAFYMTRVMLMTFFGKKRWAADAHPHEAPATMAWPMIVLAFGSVFAGGLLGVGGTLQHWLEPVTTFEESPHVAPTWVISAVAVGVVAVGFLIALWRYLGRTVPETAPADVSVLTVAARRDLYGDVFNEDVFMRPGAQLTHTLVEFDNKGVDGSVNALAQLVSRLSERLRGFQTGFARNYALSMLAGAALVAVAILAVQLWT
jgi:NADH-quinone oxidoreductase subunit L